MKGYFIHFFFFLAAFSTVDVFASTPPPGMEKAYSIPVIDSETFTKHLQPNSSAFPDSIVLQFIDSITNLPILGVQAQITDAQKNAIGVGISRKDGILIFKKLPDSSGFLINFMAFGYLSMKDYEINNIPKTQKIYLSPLKFQLNEFVFIEMQDSILIKGDTTSYNSELYQSKTDENFGDIIQKIPGAEIKKGKLTIEGEDVTSIKLDGEEYFKSKNAASLDQIPSEIISRIEVIDVVSPEDPSRQTKVINIITKKARVSAFGKVNGAYGSDSRYRMAGNYYFKTSHHRITAMADLNNINKEDLLSSGLTPLFEGENNFSGGGLNYNYRSAKETKFSTNILSNNTSRFQSHLFDQYLLSEPNLNPVFQTQKNNSVREKIYSFDQELITPLSSQSTLSFESKGQFLNATSVADYLERRKRIFVPDFELQSNTTSEEGLNTFKAKLQLKHQLKNKPERKVQQQKILFSAEQSERMENAENLMDYNYTNYSGWNSMQLNTSNTPVATSKALLQLTETRWGKYAVKYYISGELSENRNKITTLVLGENEWPDGRLDSVLSTSNEMSRKKVRGGIQVTRKSGKFQSGFGLNYEHLLLNGYITSPAADKFSAVFSQVLPIASFEYKQSKTKQFKVDYSTRQNAPGFHQLNPVVDNSVASRLYMGQTGLQAENTHNMNLIFRKSGAKKILHLLKIEASYTQNYIGEQMLTPKIDSLINGITIPAKTQFRMPVNLDYSWRSSVSANHEKNIPKHKYGILYGYSLDILPNKVNQTLLLTRISRYNAGIYTSYYPTKLLSVTARAFGSFANITSSSNNKINQPVLNWNAGGSIRYLFRHSLLISLESNSFQVVAINKPSNKIITSIINISLKQGLFKHQKASIQLQVHDLFNQNRDITQNPTALFITQEQRLMLGRYVLLGFAIKL
jgi:hypothetical protein